METNETITVEYTLTQAIEAAKALLPHLERPTAQADKVITHMMITPDGETWAGTNRYTIGTYTFQQETALADLNLEAAKHDGPQEMVLLPWEAVDFIGKTNMKKLRAGMHRPEGYRLKITSKPNEVVVEVFHQLDPRNEPILDYSQAFDVYRGQAYPEKVLKLIPTDYNENTVPTALVNPQYMESMVKSAKALGENMEFHANGNKAMLVILGDQFRGVIATMRKRQ